MNRLARAAAHQPDMPALVQDGRSLSYRELARAAAGGAAVLGERGAAHGSLALWQADATLASIAWLHALWWQGSIVLPTAPAMPTSRLEALKRRFEPALSAGGDRAADIDTTQMPPDADGVPPPADANGPMTLMLTSGSSAAPKAVPLSLRQHEASVAAIRERLQFDSRDRWLLCLPLDHIGGLAILVRAVFTGGTVVVHERFDPETVLATCRSQPVTLMSVVPTMLARLVERTGERLRSRLRAILVGGAPCDPALLARARRLGLPVLPTWGMTEAASQLATLSPAEAEAVDFEAHPGIAGRPLDGVEVRIGSRDASDRSGGEIQVRGPMLFEGYWAQGADSARAGDGWFRTGDRGHLDGNGVLYVTGRERDRIISGGVNVSAPIVERALTDSGLAADAAVIGLPDDEWGQCVAAVVVPASRIAPESLSRALREWAAGNLDPAERPRRWRVVETVPRTSAGKPDRERIESMFEPQGRPKP
ncbi:MAG: class I adenylate-forming enzyme family protein [Candidatus Wenzhouxiangella sp. M2_3B_020]